MFLLTRANRKKNKKAKGSHKLIIVLVVIALLVTASGITVNRLGFAAANKHNGEMQLFEFEEEENMHTISRQLEEAGVIKNAFFFRLRAKSKNIEYIGKAGKYRFSPSMKPDAILNTIQSGDTAYDLQMVIPEGYDFDEILRDFSATEEEFITYQQKINDVNYIQTLKEKFTFLPDEILGEGFRYRLEGFMANGTYELRDESTLEEYVDMALTRFQEEYEANGIEAKLAERNMSLYDAVTMAALVRGEVFSGDTENQKIVAGVFNNRLAQGMPMGSDVTVGYSIGKKDVNYTMEELENPSPYNTYVNPGLPHGPINNPGFDVIQAVIDPTESNYIYFLADICDDGKGEFGKIYYSETIDQHDAYRQEYLQCIY